MRGEEGYWGSGEKGLSFNRGEGAKRLEVEIKLGNLDSLQLRCQFGN